MSEAPNPYATPMEVPANDPYGAFNSGQEELAGRLTRFAAAMLDGILMMVIIFPIYVMTGFLARSATQQVGLVEQLLMSLLGAVVMLILNGYLLATRGQTIGKAATSIQIVDFESNRLLSFMRVYVYRYLWTLPLVLVVMFIPGQADDFLINFVVFVDILFIFRSDRRCIHDLIAGSRVVLYRPDRDRLVGG